MVHGFSFVLLHSHQLWDAQAGGTWAPPPRGTTVLAIAAEPREEEPANHTDFLNLLKLKVIKTPFRMLQYSFNLPLSTFRSLQLPNATLKLKLGLRPPMFYTSAPVQGDPG